MPHASPLLRVQGLPASPGMGAGRVWRLPPRMPAVACAPRRPVDRDLESRRIERALREADAALGEESARARSGPAPMLADVLETHRAMLADPNLDREIADGLASGMGAEQAVHTALDTWAERLRVLEDATLRERAEDIVDLDRRIARILAGAEGRGLPTAPFEACVLVADILGPSDTALLTPSRVLAIATERGGAFSHAAIVARTLGIPAVVGMGPLGVTVRTGGFARVDGDHGRFEYGPTPLDGPPTPAPSGQPAVGGGPCRLADGTALSVLANIGSETDADAALAAGAEGVGLWRTEWLEPSDNGAPEDALASLFARVARRFAPHPVTLRMLDAGGDKPIVGRPPLEAVNPALSLRGVRLLDTYPDVFARQARAAVRACADAPNLRWMVPMAAHPAELRAVHSLLTAACDDVRRDGGRARMPDLGAMVEVPAAAAALERFQGDAAFVSIGTNDLAQYTLGADRDDATVAYLLQGMDPAVLRLVAWTVRTAAKVGIEVSACGEAAGEPWALPLLVGAGVRAFSMAPSRIHAARAVLERIDPSAARRLFRKACLLDDGGAVRRSAEGYLRRIRSL